MKESFKQNKTKRGKKNKISFDEEIVSKDQAEKLLSEQELDSIKSSKQIERTGHLEFKPKEKNKKRKQTEKDSKNKEKLKPKKKRTDDNQATENSKDTTESSGEIESIVDPTIPVQKKKESNRANKRKKHAQLIEQKKLNSETESQQKTLNYLSKWKHSRSEWKFEKLKQVWIQQNLFDSAKIPSEFWETTVEYFSGAQGHSRQVVLDDALKIIENEVSTEENLDDDYQVKLKRARNIVQSLQ